MTATSATTLMAAMATPTAPTVFREGDAPKEEFSKKWSAPTVVPFGHDVVEGEGSQNRPDFLVFEKLAPGAQSLTLSFEGPGKDLPHSFSAGATVMWSAEPFRWEWDGARAGQVQIDRANPTGVVTIRLPESFKGGPLHLALYFTHGKELSYAIDVPGAGKPVAPPPVAPPVEGIEAGSDRFVIVATEVTTLDVLANDKSDVGGLELIGVAVSKARAGGVKAWIADGKLVVQAPKDAMEREVLIYEVRDAKGRVTQAKVEIGIKQPSIDSKDVAGTPFADVLKTDGGVIFALNGADTLYGADNADTMWAGNGEDLVYGGGGADVLYGGDGNDAVKAGWGDDAVYGGHGDDTILGEEGADILYGGIGDDVIYGDAGDDMAYGDEGRDLIYGGSGNDALWGGRDSDTLVGDEGNDVLYGGEESDKLIGDAGDDSLFGGEGNDALDGGDGADRLMGDAGDDELYGGEGDDVLFGGSGHDTMWAGAGDDTLVGGLGRDVLAGGKGADVFRWTAVAEMGRGDAADRITDFVLGEDRLDLGGVLGGAKLVFLGASAFTRSAGEFRFDAATQTLSGDLNGDGVRDVSLVLEGVSSLSPDSFLA